MGDGLDAVRLYPGVEWVWELEQIGGRGGKSVEMAIGMRGMKPLTEEVAAWMRLHVARYQTWAFNYESAGRALYLVAGAVFFLVVFWEQYSRRRERQAKLPPGPFQWPYVGSLPHLVFTAGVRSSSRLRDNVTALATKHGPLMFLQLMDATVLVVSRGDLAKEVSGNTFLFSLLVFVLIAKGPSLCCGLASVAEPLNHVYSSFS